MLTVVIITILLGLIYWKHESGIKALPDHLKYKTHNDYTFPFCFIPRSLTAYKLTQPPRTAWQYNCVSMTYHNNQWGVNPIQNKLNGRMFSAHLNLPYFYFSLSTCWGWYFIVGMRWDAVDFYYNFLTLDISKIGRFEP